MTSSFLAPENTPADCSEANTIPASTRKSYAPIGGRALASGNRRWSVQNHALRWLHSLAPARPKSGHRPPTALGLALHSPLGRWPAPVGGTAASLLAAPCL